MLKINEIFYSIQGESSYVGLPTVFVRTTGCNLRCTYCDTKYSYYDGEWITQDELITKILSFNCRHVCITGGEPLLQKNIFAFMTKLCDLGLILSLETSGSKSCEKVDPRVKVILDLKTPSSGEVKANFIKNLQFLPETAEIKFVIGDLIDFEWAESLCRQHNLFNKYTVLYSPSFGAASPKWLAEQILQQNSSARLQLQQHKYIWSPETRSV